MIGNAKKLVQYLEGSDKRFLIPVYQRNYEWHEPQCRQLFNDLEDIVHYGRENHFFGSIVSINYNGGYEFQIIDGQQRITTISLLILALYHLLDKNEVTSQNEHLKTKLMEDYLVDKYQPKEKRIKLKATSNNQEFYALLFNDPDNEIKTSNIVNNFNYFLRRIRSSSLSADGLFESIRKLMIIDIIINETDDPQKIFESINSTGLDLSEADKIRNFLLMSLGPHDQEILYDNFWKKIEKNCIDDSQKVSMFIRDYLTIKTGYVPKIGNVYFEFKVYFEKNRLNRSDLIKELYTYSILYNAILVSKYVNNSISYSLKRINQIEATVTFPFLLELFMLNSNHVISNDDLLEILEIVETFLFRRIIVDLPSNALNKIFATLHKDIIKLLNIDSSANYKEVFCYLLKNKKGSSRFPSDEEFIEGLKHKDIYLMNQKNKHYLFEKMENNDNVEHINVYDLLKIGTLSIEHIMPQVLTESWIVELGDSWNEIHLNWLHKLANLTLTGYNSKYSNQPFERKKNIDKGFKDSSLTLNTYLKTIDHWTLNELKLREEQLVKIARDLWPDIESSFSEIDETQVTYTLMDDIDFSYYQILSFNLFGENLIVKSWKDFYIKTFQILYSRNQVQFINTIVENEYLKNYLNHPTLESFEIDHDYKYVHHMSTNAKLNILRVLFDALSLEQTELSFEVVNGKQPEKLNLWSIIKPDFENKVTMKLGSSGRFVTFEGMNVYEVMTPKNLLRIKLSYSIDYTSTYPEYRGNGWYSIHKDIQNVDFTHIVFAIYNEFKEFDYVLLTKNEFIQTFAERLANQHKKLNVYIGVTKDNKAFERRYDPINLSEKLNNWEILNNR
jgi:uncharacterized protein with ParB-like and HNH nuclease domain